MIFSETRKNQWEKWNCLIFLWMSGFIGDSWSLIRFCIQSFVISHIMQLWKTPPYTSERVRVKKANNASITGMVLIFQSWRGLPGSHFEKLSIEVQYFTLPGNLRLEYRQKLPLPAFGIVGRLKGRGLRREKARIYLVSPWAQVQPLQPWEQLLSGGGSRG